MAACHASAQNVSVILFEKQNKIGRKLLVTGNGRCNISNTHISVERYHGHNPRFTNNVFGRYGLTETIYFFKSIGLPLTESEDGKLFPLSLRAVSVVELLEYEAIKRGTEIKLHRQVGGIEKRNDSFVITTSGKEKFEFDNIILSTGGCAYPQLGASREGYELARSLGHTIHEPFPSIIPINIPLKSLHKLQGIKCQAIVAVHNNGKKLTSSEGELLFTGFGISGPVSLDVSRRVNELVLCGEQPSIVIDLYPGFTENELSDIIQDLLKDKERTLTLSLTGIMHKKMAEILLEIAGIDPQKKAGNLIDREKETFVDVLKRLTVIPGKPREFREAVTSAGGVDVNEIDGATMESRIIRNLYLTGEVLDIDGDTGGYNLQFAWSTGAIAGLSQR